MASINRVNLEYIKRWEGGLSKDPRDPAAVDPVPDGQGYHTNKGVTWATFKGLAPKLGYRPTPDLFYKMPDDVWLKIYKVGYWDPVQGDKINSQGIAELMADWAWGSGPGTATIHLQRYLNRFGYGLFVDGSAGPKTIGALNDHIRRVGAKPAFDGLYKARMAFLQSLSNWGTYAAGWTNRMKDFYDYGIKVAATNPLGTFFFIAGTVLVVLNLDKIEKAFKSK